MFETVFKKCFAIFFSFSFKLFVKIINLQYKTALIIKSDSIVSSFPLSISQSSNV